MTSLIHALYAASLVDRAKLLIPYPSLPTLEFCYRCAGFPFQAFVGNLSPFAQPPNLHYQRNMDGWLELYETERLVEKQLRHVYNSVAS